MLLLGCSYYSTPVAPFKLWEVSCAMPYLLLVLLLGKADIFLARIASKIILLLSLSTLYETVTRQVDCSTGDPVSET